MEAFATKALAAAQDQDENDDDDDDLQTHCVYCKVVSEDESFTGCVGMHMAAGMMTVGRSCVVTFLWFIAGAQAKSLALQTKGEDPWGVALSGFVSFRTIAIVTLGLALATGFLLGWHAHRCTTRARDYLKKGDTKTGSNMEAGSRKGDTKVAAVKSMFHTIDSRTMLHSTLTCGKLRGSRKPIVERHV